MKKRENQRKNKKTIIWGGGMLSLFMLVMTSILFSFPNIEQYQSFGAVVYDKESQIIGYVLHRYDEEKNKTREEYYNFQGKLIKYQDFEYETSGLLTHRSDYDPKSELLLKVSFVNKNGLLDQKKIQQKGKELEIQYSYVYDRAKTRVLSRLSQMGKNNGFQSTQEFSDKVTYQYLPNGKRVERYKKSGQQSGSEYQLNSAELYCYRGDGKETIQSILTLDSAQRPYKYIQYRYQDQKIQEVTVHQIQNQYFAWRGDCQNQKFPDNAMVLKNRFVYAYNSNPFQSFREKQLGYTPSIQNEVPQSSEPAYALEEDLALTKEDVQFYSSELQNTDKKIDKLSEELRNIKNGLFCPAGEAWIDEARECEEVDGIDQKNVDTHNIIFSQQETETETETESE